MINVLKSIGLGVIVGALSSVCLSLTLEEEVSEQRMALYGGFISAIAASISVASVSYLKRNGEEEKPDLPQTKTLAIEETQRIMAQVIIDGFNNHLNSLQPGSLEYQKALESYGNLLATKTFPLPTKTEKP